MIQTILPIAGVPDELIRVLNSRLRELANMASNAVAASPSPANPAASPSPAKLVPDTAVQGAENLIHVGTVPLVTSDRTLAESAMVDDGKNVLVAGRQVGIGTTPAASAALAVKPLVNDTGVDLRTSNDAYTGVQLQANTVRGVIGVYSSGVRVITLNGANGNASATSFTAAGAAGLTSSRSVISSVVPVTSTLSYKDWAGTNQSITNQIGTAVGTTTYGFTGGLLTT